jgi:hypothetical protein
MLSCLRHPLPKMTSNTLPLPLMQCRSFLVCLAHTTAQQGLQRGLDTPLSAPVNEPQVPTLHPHSAINAAIPALAAGGAQGTLPLPHGLLFPQVERGKLAHVQRLCLLFVENDQIQALRHRHRIRLTSRYERNAAELKRRSRVQCCRRVDSGGHAKATAHPRRRRCGAHYGYGFIAILPNGCMCAGLLVWCELVGFEACEQRGWLSLGPEP